MPEQEPKDMGGQDPQALEGMLNAGTPEQRLEGKKREALTAQRFYAGRVNGLLREIQERYPEARMQDLYEGMKEVIKVQEAMRWTEAYEEAGVDPAVIDTAWDIKEGINETTKGEGNE